MCFPGEDGLSDEYGRSARPELAFAQPGHAYSDCGEQAGTEELSLGRARKRQLRVKSEIGAQHRRKKARSESR